MSFCYAYCVFERNCVQLNYIRQRGMHVCVCVIEYFFSEPLSYAAQAHTNTKSPIIYILYWIIIIFMAVYLSADCDISFGLPRHRHSNADGDQVETMKFCTHLVVRTIYWYVCDYYVLRSINWHLISRNYRCIFELDQQMECEMYTHRSHNCGTRCHLYCVHVY